MKSPEGERFEIGFIKHRRYLNRQFIGNTIGYSIGNTIANTIGNTIGNSIGNTIGKLMKFIYK